MQERETRKAELAKQGYGQAVEELEGDTPKLSRSELMAGGSDQSPIVQADDQTSAAELNRGMVRYFGDKSWENAYVQVELPDALSGLREAVATGFGRELVGVFGRTRGSRAINGVNYQGKLYLNVNVNADVGFVQLGGHELLHQLKRDRPDLYRWFAGQARGYYKNFSAYQDKLNALLKPGESPYNKAAAEEELLADFAGDALADPQFVERLAKADPGRFRQLLKAVMDWLKQVGDKLSGKGLGSSEYFTDVEALRNYLADALVAYGQGGAVGVRKVAGPKFSLSAMKSVDANILRGRKSLASALTDKTTVHRAMFRNGLGWVDFVWGDIGLLKASGRYKGAKGLSHILEARQTKDGMSEAQSIRLMENIVDAIAKGSEFERSVLNNSTRVGVRNNNVIVWLTKQKGNNAWIVTGYEERNPGDAGAGRATSASTASTASLTRSGSGAGFDSNLTQDSDESNIRFSRRSDLNNYPDEREGSGIEEDPEALFADIDDAIRKGGGWNEAKGELEKRWNKLNASARRQWLGALTVHQLVELGGKVLPRMERYLKEMTGMDVTRNKVLYEVDG
jgi:hypothetical protein